MAARHVDYLCRAAPRRMAWASDSESATLDGYKVTGRLHGNLQLYEARTVDLEEKERYQDIMERLAHDNLRHDDRMIMCAAERLTGSPAYAYSGRYRNHCYPLQDPEYFYLTTNKKEFQGIIGAPALNARPRSSRFYPSKGKTEPSLYETEYQWKKALEKRNSSHRPGSSSGQRKNKPHPLETFMIWKFPGRLPPVDTLKDYKNFYDNKSFMEQVSKEGLKSTYQKDYRGLPQDVQVQTALEGCYPISKAEKAPFTLDSTSRFEYQPPCLHENLKNNTLRYGCNTRKNVPALGAVPNVSPNAPIMQLHGESLYSQQFSDKSGKAGINNYLRPQEAIALDRYFKSAKREDREDMINLIRSLALDDDRVYELQRLSDWSGPK